MRWLLAVVLLLPLPLAGVVTAQVADAAGRALGAHVERVVATVLLAQPREPAPVAVVPEEPSAGESTVVLAATSKRAERHVSRDRKAARSVFISARVVLRLANHGARPRGVPVSASGARPAGLLLAGVGALGVGLRDGDILTHAAGVPALHASGVVSAVLAARGRGAPTITGRFWRNGQPWLLVVEQPYPSAAEQSRAAADAELAQPGRKRGA